MTGERRIRERAQGTRGGSPRLRNSPPNSQRLDGAAKGLAAPPSIAASLRRPRESRARQGHSLHPGAHFRGRVKGRGHKKPTGIIYGAPDAPYRGALLTEALAFPTVRAVPTLGLCPTLHCGNATLEALPPVTMSVCRVAASFCLMYIIYLLIPSIPPGTLAGNPLPGSAPCRECARELGSAPCAPCRVPGGLS